VSGGPECAIGAAQSSSALSPVVRQRLFSSWRGVSSVGRRHRRPGAHSQRVPRSPAVAATARLGRRSASRGPQTVHRMGWGVGAHATTGFRTIMGRITEAAGSGRRAHGRGTTVEVQDDPGISTAGVRRRIRDLAGQAWVAHSLRLRPFWLFPLISTVLLVASIAVYESREEPGLAARICRTRSTRCSSSPMQSVSCCSSAGVFLGSSLRPSGCCFAGLALWLVNLAVFALLYWELDGGGPEARADGYRGRYPDLVFPQQQATKQGLASATWKPELLRLRLSLAYELHCLLSTTPCPTRSGPSSRMGVQTCSRLRPWPFSSRARSISLAGEMDADETA